MADYSWIEPSTKNIANLFGLNPEAAAKGRALQSQQEYDAARTANTQADTGLSPYRQRLLEAQAQTQAAQAGKFGADTRFRNTETEGLAEQQRQLKIAQQFINDNFTMDASGRPVPKPGTLGQTMAAVVAAGGVKNISNSGQVIKDYSLIGAPTSREANLLAGGANATAAAKPTFAGTDEQAQAMTLQQQAADQAKAIEVAKVRGTIAQTLAKGGQPGQPSSRDLLNQAEAIKIGAGYAQTVPQNGLELNEVQALQLSRAAQAANPNLNPQDAIDKFVRDNPDMIKDGGWWSSNTFNIPATDRAAPAARPVAPAPATAEPVRITNDDSGKAAYARLPSGTPFVDPNGQRRIKP